MQVAFYGSNVEIREPKIVVSTHTKDFGPGFYCTVIKEQAQRWARKFDDGHVVNHYVLRKTEGLKIKNFETMTDEWLDFIVSCRNGKKHDFDIVIGAMADDQIYNFISDFLSGDITREQFWVMIKFRYPTHQICFCSTKSLECLSFIKSEVLND